jgi:hypothetical protein
MPNSIDSTRTTTTGSAGSSSKTPHRARRVRAAGHGDRATIGGSRTDVRQAVRTTCATRAGWDLEGQRELEYADAGYTPQAGSLSEYQDGYREGFRSAYREGYDATRDGR